MVDLQVLQFDNRLLSFASNCTFSNSFSWIFNVLGVLIFIPVINFGFLPFLREYAPTMLLKITTGIVVMTLGVCAFLALTVTANVEHQQNHHNSNLMCLFNTSSSTPTQGDFPLSVWWLVLPYSLISLAEVLINISSKFFSATLVVFIIFFVFSFL